MAAPGMEFTSAFARALSFLTLSAEKWKKHSCNGGGGSCRRMASSSLANLRGTGTGQVSRNHRSSTGGGRSHVAPPLRLKSDQVLTKCQNVVPSPTAWLSDAATKTASSSSVTWSASSGARRDSPSTEAASALTSPLSGNRDATSSRGM